MICKASLRKGHANKTKVRKRAAQRRMNAVHSRWRDQHVQSYDGESDFNENTRHARYD